MATLESFSQSMALEQRVEMYVLVLVAIILCILFKILNVNNSPEKSLFYCSNQKFLEEFLKRAPELTEPYIPTRFWGYSGHLQTIIQVRLAVILVECNCFVCRASCNVSTLWIKIVITLKHSLTLRLSFTSIRSFTITHQHLRFFHFSVASYHRKDKTFINT